MITTKETLPNSRVKLTFTASHAQFEKALALELESVAKSVKIPGFRPGKAPEAKVIEQVGRRRLEAGAIDRVISLVYSEDMSGQREVIAVANPDRVDVTEFTVAPADATPETVVATFTLEVDVLPDVTIDGYKKIKLEKPAATKVEQDEVDKVVDYLRRQRAAMEDAPEGTKVETGMWVDLSYKGSVDDVPRDDMHNESHPIVVGEGQLIPGFEDHLIGMQAGEIKTFKITFPAEYHSEALQGKEAEFMVTVKELKVVKLPRD